MLVTGNTIANEAEDKADLCGHLFIVEGDGDEKFSVS